MLLWNWIDMLNIAGSIVFVAGNFADFMTQSNLNVIGSICVLLFFIKLIYYLRVFEDYAIFIRMVIEMISAPEMLQFWLMLAVSLAGFSFVFIILNFNRGDDIEPIFDDFTGITVVDAVLHAWLTGLGDFNFDNYSAANSPMTWGYFFLATVIVQLVFMNLLIAIMSEQYVRLNDSKEQNKLKEICRMIKDHTWLLRPYEIFEHDRYILVLGPNRGRKGETATESKLQDLRDYVENRVDKSDEDLARNIDQIQDRMVALQLQQIQN